MCMNVLTKNPANTKQIYSGRRPFSGCLELSRYHKGAQRIAWKFTTLVMVMFSQVSMLSK